MKQIMAVWELAFRHALLRLPTMDLEECAPIWKALGVDQLVQSELDTRAMIEEHPLTCDCPECNKEV